MSGNPRHIHVDFAAVYNTIVTHDTFGVVHVVFVGSDGAIVEGGPVGG